METELEARCPGDFRRLFFKYTNSGGKPEYVQPENLIQIACGDCARSARKQGKSVKQVLHYFNFIGECVKTEEVYGPDVI